MHVKPFFQSCFAFLPHTERPAKQRSKIDVPNLGGPQTNKPKTGRFFAGHLNLPPALEMRQSF